MERAVVADIVVLLERKEERNSDMSAEYLRIGCNPTTTHPRDGLRTERVRARLTRHTNPEFNQESLRATLSRTLTGTMGVLLENLGCAMGS